MRWRELPLQQLATWLVEGVSGISPWLKKIESMLEDVLSNQEVIDAYAQKIVAATTELSTEIQALKDAAAAGETLSFAGLDNAVKGLEAIESPATPPADTTTPDAAAAS